MQTESRRCSRIASWLIIAVGLAGCNSSTPTKPAVPAGSGTDAADAATAVANPRDVKVPASETSTVTVYSNPPGCLVFVNAVPVRGEGDALALTPCEITVPHGHHAISVEKPGGRRKTEQIHVEGRRDLDFDVSSTPTDFDEPAVINAPLFEAAVGRSIALASLNTTARELDPFLSDDGLTIYYASDRDGLRGIYMATRPSPYHTFNDPTIVPASGGADMPASPSVSGDGLIMVYAVPEKSRLWQLTRTDPSAPWGNKEIARGDEQGERAWPSAQLSDDGLRLYWTEESAETTVTRAAVRSTTGKLFGKTLTFEIPGQHPHLTADGLRHFSFDGEKLRRSRRGSHKQPFGEPEIIAELTVENYAASPHHRQFWVTQDEQWLFYCDNPMVSGDLFVVRLSDGPGWGRQYVAKSVADKTSVASTEPENKPMPQPETTPAVDPRRLPLAYSGYWDELVKLLADRQVDEATALVRQAQQDKAFHADRQLLEWDLELAESQVEFDRDVKNGLMSLKPGAAIRVGGTRFEFERAEEDVLHLKLKDKEITRKLSDLSPGERISLADSGPEKADAVKALRFGIFLHFQGPAQQTLAESWFKRAGAGGTEFFERLARRVLHQAQAELARGNLANGIKLLDSVAGIGGPGTAAAREAAADRSTLYDKLVWNAVGPRKWKRGEQGEFIAEPARSNDSYQRSEVKYGDFELNCEWRTTSATALGGIYLRYSGQGKPLENGAKIHLASDSDLKRMDRYATGSLFGQVAPTANASLGEGKWNTLRIQVRGTYVHVWINDKEVLDGTLGKDVPATGYLMLDGVGGGVSYRKVLIFELGSNP